MKANMMRAPLIKSAAVLLVFVLLAYLTSASPEGSVLNSVGLIIIGAFRLVQWVVAMAIGLTVCIAFLIGIFLFAAFLVDKNISASMYEGVKRSVAVLIQPLFSSLSAFKCKESSCSTASPVQTATGADQLKDELQNIIAGEVQKVTAHQQTLNDQFTTLHTKIVDLEEKSAQFATAVQLEAIATDITASGKMLETVQGNVAMLESKLLNTAQQLEAMTPDKILGDIPSRLGKLEEKGDVFDPQPLTDSLQSLQKEVEEMKKRTTGNTKAKKKA